jgi:DNA replication and repair protein RecF
MDGRMVPAARASSGQHKRVLMRWLAGQARLLKARKGEAPLVLIDELGAHLDAAGRTEVLEALKGLGAQAWVSDVAVTEGEADRVVRLG